MSVIERVAVLFNTASRWVAASAWPSLSRPSNSISASIPPGLGGIRIPTGSLPLVITRGPDFGRFRRTFAVSFESSRVFKRSEFTKAMSDTWGTFVKSQFGTPPGAPRVPRSGSRNGFRWLLACHVTTPSNFFFKNPLLFNLRSFSIRVDFPPFAGYFPPSAIRPPVFSPLCPRAAVRAPLRAVARLKTAP